MKTFTKFLNLKTLFVFFILGNIIICPADIKAQDIHLPEQDTIYEMKNLDKPLISTFVGMAMIVIKQTTYPDVKKKNRKKGTVTVKIILDEEGNAINPIIIESLGKEYDEEAMRIVAFIQQKKWEIPLKSGVPVKTFITIPFTFDYKKMKK